MIDSLCTIATGQCWAELQLMVKSFRLYHPETPIYIVGDKDIWYNALYTLEGTNLGENIIWFDGIESKNWKQVGGSKADWLELMLKKTEAMDEALFEQKSTLFVDSDMIFVAPVEIAWDGPDVYLSPHLIKHSQEEAYGTYNGGFVATNNKHFPIWWKEYTLAHPDLFYEQQTLDYTSEAFDIDLLPKAHNFAWYRFSKEHNPQAGEERYVSWYDGHNFKYMNQTISSFHTHLNNKEERFSVLNQFILYNLKHTDNPKHKEIYEYINTLALNISV